MKIKSFECPKSKPPTHCFIFNLLNGFNDTWTIRHLVDGTTNPAAQHIILKIVGFLEKVIRNSNCLWHMEKKSFIFWGLKKNFEAKEEVKFLKIKAFWKTVKHKFSIWHTVTGPGSQSMILLLLQCPMPPPTKGKWGNVYSTLYCSISKCILWLILCIKVTTIVELTVINEKLDDLKDKTFIKRIHIQ
jgi:hypothetical protein